MKEIITLQPEGLWKHFDTLTQIPRPSKKEARVVEFIKDFGLKTGLETHADDIGNVIIRKPATIGMENSKGVILQAHLDMVPQKNSGKEHDFEKDPIETIVDGEWVKANGTTLGADNGIGVASIMAVLESKSLIHGPLEALFTVDEETGMTGAFHLKPGMLTGDILLNLDSEDEGELYVGCAGGIDGNFIFDYESESVPASYVTFTVSVSGLKGGHSGLDIPLGRGNSNIILFRLLYGASRKTEARIADVEGGNMRNAIPREAIATIVIPEKQASEMKTLLEQIAQTIKTELRTREPSLKIEINKTGTAERMMKKGFQDCLIASVIACPNGVIRMSDDMPGLIETSTNLSIVKTVDKKVSVHCLLRSSVDTAKLALADRMRALFEMAGAEVDFTGEYPGWKPNMDSVILKVMKKVYERKYGREPAVKAIHAGLECGIIGGVYPNLDMISFGPTIRNPHSPDEKVNIDSVKKFWDFLTDTLKNIP
ncbi:MAG: aminoacyl-histidine dipeptidase [Bacteroidales bacterium]|nr:aminoacyl-histidine dipeptidase [Bacteroidales bacterium]